MSKGFNRKKAWDQSGVSEVVGTLLILGLTVVLFSSMIVMVGNIPAPVKTSATAIDATLEFRGGNPVNGGWVNITNGGGQVLKGLFTEIILTIGNLATTYKTTGVGVWGLNATNGNWTTGATWHRFIANPMSWSTNISAMIINVERNQVVWSDFLQGGSVTNSAPVIMGIWADVDLTQGTPEKESIMYNRNFTVYAKIVDFDRNLNPASIIADCSAVGGVNNLALSLHPTLNDVYWATTPGPANAAAANAGFHPIVVRASDLSTPPKTTVKSQIVSVGGAEEGLPILQITFPTGYTFSDDRPVHGQKVQVTAVVKNIGTEPSKSANVTFWDDGILKKWISVGLPVQGSQEVIWDWTPGYSGLHNVTAKIAPIDPLEDGEPTLYKWARVFKTVTPTILIVDDDGHVNDKSVDDTSAYMRAALEAANFKYSFQTVSVGDGPGYNTGQGYQMKDFDIVIWMTGYMKTSTLTQMDVSNLQKFLTAAPRAGSLWLVSQGMLAEAAMPGKLWLNQFANLNLQLSTWNAESPRITEPFKGVAGDPVSSYLSFGQLDLVKMGVNAEDGFRVTPNANGNVSLVDQATGLNCYASRCENTLLKSRVFFTPWEFSRVSDTADQAQFAYQVIKWLGNLSSTLGLDLSVSEQYFIPTTVYFKQQVRIYGTVRNNGPYNMTGVQVRATVYNSEGIPIWYNETRVDILALVNNSVTVGPFIWIPANISTHKIVVMVDPDNEISNETNEDNNVVSDYLGVGWVDVRYRLLVVDDDNSPQDGPLPGNPGGPGYNETANVVSALQSIGYSWETILVPSGLNGPGATTLADYNAVIWVAGRESNALTSNDTANLQTFLTGGGRLWLMGENATDLAAGDSFRQNFLGINVASGSNLNPARLYGVYKDPISHATNYRMKPSSYCDVFTPMPGATGIFYQSTNNFCGVRYSLSGFRTVTTGFSFERLNGTDQFPGSDLAKSELVYMVLHWFEMPEPRVELRLFPEDLWVSEAQPQLGDSYVLQATVRNVGGGSGNCLVRFLDGTTQIGSDSISVSPNSNTTAEMIWTPLFAGLRTIRVQVDPLAEQPEVFDWFNNNASFTTYVYFFYDDMEDGTSKWSHESTIMLVNGETPLDYMSNTVVSVNIAQTWDWASSVNLTNCTDPGYYHTYNSSYWLQEPTGGASVTRTRPPMDIVFVLDSSGSMAWDQNGNPVGNTNPTQKMYQAKLASTNFLKQMTENDRAAVYCFNGNAQSTRRLDWAYMTAANIATFNTSIWGINPNGGTPFYDTLGNGIQYSLTYDPTGSDMSRYEYVIALTDGVSNSDNTWTPKTTWGSVIWDNSYGGGANKKGLIGCPPMVYTIGICMGSAPGTYDDHNPAYPVAPSWQSTYTGGATYTVEYDLWHSANNTPRPEGKYGWNNTTMPHRPNVGHYYYTDQPGQLPGIFQDIMSSMQQIQLEGENVTRSADPQPFTAPSNPGTKGGEPGGPGTESVPPPPQTNAVSIYRIGACTQAAGPHHAYFDDVDNPMTQWDASNVNSRNEFTNTQYTQAGTSENTRTGTGPGDPGNGDGMAIEYRMAIAETPSDITGIALLHEAQYSVANTVVTMYAWNAVANNWDTIGTMTFTNANTDYTMNRSIGANWANYISGGILRWMAWPSLRATVSVDFTQTTITYTARSRATITNVAPASPSSNPTPIITYQIQPPPAIVPTNVEIYYSINGAFPWVLWGTDGTPDGNWPASVALPADGFYNFSARGISASSENVPAGAASIEYGPWQLDTTAPMVSSTQPANLATNVPIWDYVGVTFDEQMNVAIIPTLSSAPIGTGDTWVGWQNASRTAVWSHTNWQNDLDYTVTVSGAQDIAGNVLAAPYVWTFHTAVAASATALGPTQTIGTTNSTPEVIYSVVGAPRYVWLYYTADNGFSWTYWGNDTSVNGLWYSGGSPLPASGYYGFLARAWGGGSLELAPVSGGADAPEIYPYNYDDIDPYVQGTQPSNGQNNVVRGLLVKVRFNERMRTSTIPTIAGGGPYSFAGWVSTAVYQDTATWTHSDWAASTTVTITVSGAMDYAGNSMGAAHAWSFTTGVETGTGGSGNDGKAPAGTNSNKSAISQAVNLTNVQTATLSFWHKYNIVPGVNGGVLMVGYRESAGGAWKWKYVVPSSAYTGNLRLNDTNRRDSMGQFIQWGWNGVSGRGTFTWEKVSLDILPYVNTTGIGTYKPYWQVKVKFAYYQYGGGTGYGWYIDDVKIGVSRADSSWANNTADAWRRVKVGASYGPGWTHTTHGGNYSWWNGDYATGYFKKGIDNSLMAGPVDLTGARNATMTAFFKFNINTKDGAPPDGFRVEVSKDNGVTWVAINLGVRTAWNVSGYELDAGDGKAGDGKAYSGLPPGGIGGPMNAAAAGYWVAAGTLSRLNVDLTPFIGNAIMFRFRVVTNSLAGYAAYKSTTVNFGGFYVDDVTILGNTILG